MRCIAIWKRFAKYDLAFILVFDGCGCDFFKFVAPFNLNCREYIFSHGM